MNCTVHELKHMMDSEVEFLLLDVRTTEELAIASLPDVTHLPLHELRDRAHELETWKHQQVICMCHHGGRSAMAQQYLLDLGFTDVWNLAGGIHAWSEAIDPAVPRYE